LLLLLEILVLDTFTPLYEVDDALDVFISHGFCGFVGALLTGVFAHNAVNAGIDNGIYYGGNWTIFKANLIGSIVVIIYSMLITKLLYIQCLINLLQKQD
jgi:ammonia channel protein AmtB